VHAALLVADLDALAEDIEAGAVAFVRARNDSSQATAIRKRVTIAFDGASMARAVENRPDSQLFAVYTHHR